MDIVRNKNALMIVLSTFISALGTGLHFIASTWLIYEVTKSSISVGLFIAISSIPGIITSPFTGVIVDRVNRKKIALSMDIFRALFVLLIPIIYSLDNNQLWILYIAAIFITIGGNFFYPAMSGIIKSLPGEITLQVVSANSSAIQLGMIIGAGTSGFIVATTSVHVLFYLNSFSFLLSAVFLLFVDYKSDSLHNSHHKISFFKDFKEGLNYLAINKQLLFFSMIGIVSGGIVNLINSILSSYTVESLNAGVKTYGILDSLYAAGSVVMGFTLSIIKNKFSPQSIITISLLMMSICLEIIGISSNLYMAGLGLFLLGAFIMLESVNRKTIIIQNTSNEFIGRVESINWIMYSSVGPLIAVITSFIANFINDRYVFSGFGIFVFLLSIMCYLTFKKKKVLNIKKEYMG
ncbi:MFS transporter [Bacillus sp. AC79A.1]